MASFENLRSCHHIHAFLYRQKMAVFLYFLEHASTESVSQASKKNKKKFRYVQPNDTIGYRAGDEAYCQLAQMSAIGKPLCIVL